MYKDSTIKCIDGTLSRLKGANMSIYKISKILDEPEPTLHNMLKTKKTKYSEDRVLSILTKINNYLDELEGKQLKSDIESQIKIPSTGDCPEIFENYDLYIKLFELGLNSKSFNPEEKLHFAIWHRTLSAFKKNLPNDE